jgi:hypothetical protein
MILRAGMRLRSAVGEAEVVVVKVPKGDGELLCAGAPMIDRGDPSLGSPAGQGAGGPEVLIGKRYSEESAGIELLCTKAGAGPIAWNGVGLSAHAPKPLPSSD